MKLASSFRRFLALTLAAGTLFVSGCASPELCGDRVVWAPNSTKVTLGKNDRLFACGDPNHEAWKTIPPKQAASFVRSYLESKGYLEPKVEIDYEKNIVSVDAGKRAVITSITEEGAPPFWTHRPLESNLGRSLEKTTLDRIEGDALGLLRGMGYACASLKLEAHPEGKIVLKLNPGTPKTFPATFDAGHYPHNAHLLSRFEPFKLGEPYDVQKTILAARRTEAEVASSATYTTLCTGDKFERLERTLSFGPKRSWEIGIGASTEEYPLTFVRWKTNRLWSSASKFVAEAFASNIRQKISFDLKYYYSKQSPRLYVRPLFQIEKRKEPQFNQIETKASLYQGRTIDVGHWTFEPEIGFSVRRLRILTGIAPRTDILFTPEINLGARTHDFEQFRGDPRKGFDNVIAYSFIPAYEAESIAIHRLYSQGTFLINYKGYVEPRWVLGLRYTYGALVTTDGTNPDPNKKIPLDWFFPVGGDKDLRGFGRNTLPSEILGAGSVVTWGFESRWPHLFSFPIEPLVFTDLGYLGEGNFRFNPDLFLSPGFGVRSATPIGTIRATLARGMIPARGYSQFQVFISFGAEF